MHRTAGGRARPRPLLFSAVCFTPLLQMAETVMYGWLKQ